LKRPKFRAFPSIFLSTIYDKRNSLPYLNAIRTAGIATAFAVGLRATARRSVAAKKKTGRRSAPRNSLQIIVVIS
jgi:hypothetical protein